MNFFFVKVIIEEMSFLITIYLIIVTLTIYFFVSFWETEINGHGVRLMFTYDMLLSAC